MSFNTTYSKLETMKYKLKNKISFVSDCIQISIMHIIVNKLTKWNIFLFNRLNINRNMKSSLNIKYWTVNFFSNLLQKISQKLSSDSEAFIDTDLCSLFCSVFLSDLDHITAHSHPLPARLFSDEVIMPLRGWTFSFCFELTLLCVFKPNHQYLRLKPCDHTSRKTVDEERPKRNMVLLTKEFLCNIILKKWNIWK